MHDGIFVYIRTSLSAAEHFPISIPRVSFGGEPPDCYSVTNARYIALDAQHPLTRKQAVTINFTADSDTSGSSQTGRTEPDGILFHFRAAQSEPRRLVGRESQSVS